MARDYAPARELAAANHVILDDDVLFAAAYLHDMAAFPPWANDRLDHSDVAADKVDTILKSAGFPMVKIDAVRGAIRTHMFYRNPVGPKAVKMLEDNLAKVPSRVLSPAGPAQGLDGTR